MGCELEGLGFLSVLINTSHDRYNRDQTPLLSKMEVTKRVIFLPKRGCIQRL